MSFCAWLFAGTAMGVDTLLFRAHNSEEIGDIRSCCAACSHYLGKNCAYAHRNKDQLMMSDVVVKCDEAWWGLSQGQFEGSHENGGCLRQVCKATNTRSRAHSCSMVACRHPHTSVFPRCQSHLPRKSHTKDVVMKPGGCAKYKQNAVI